MERVQRLDFAGAVRSVERTPQGGIRAPAALTRTGVFRYRDTAGAERAELRHPEEVFAADSLATLRAAPVTDLHPTAPVTTENYNALSKGHVGDTIARERGDADELVVGDVIVQDAAEVALVASGERREVSCGYTCVLDPTPGTWNGERFDAVQRAIRYNHVGLGPVGWGRAGSEVSLRLDGAAVQVRSDAPGKATMLKIKVGGREYILDAAEGVAAAQGAVDDMQKKCDADGGELTAIKAALMDALQKVAAAEAKAAAATAATPPPVTEATVPDAVADALVAKRSALLTSARKVLPAETKLDGLPAAEIKRKVVSHAMPETKLDGLSPDTIDGMFTAVTSGATRNDGLANAHRAAAGEPGERREDSAETAAEKMATETRDRWKTAKPTFAVEN